MLVCVISGKMGVVMVVHAGIVDGEEDCAKWEKSAESSHASLYNSLTHHQCTVPYRRQEYRATWRSRRTTNTLPP